VIYRPLPERARLLRCRAALNNQTKFMDDPIIPLCSKKGIEVVYCQYILHLGYAYSAPNEPPEIWAKAPALRYKVLITYCYICYKVELAWNSVRLPGVD
jgi:hypothetical protein